MRALVVAHDHVSPSGPIGRRLQQRGFILEEHLVVPAERFGSPGVAAAFPDFTPYDAIVILGAPWSVYDDARIGSWVAAELEQIRHADDAGVPLLGICFGGQLLAAAHGGSVAATPHAEIGWTEVTSDDESLVASGQWFEWHFDRWNAPPEARELARSADAPQAFVLRRNLAVQFHPELTAETLLGWLENGGYDNARRAGFDPDQLIARTAVLDAENRRRAHGLVDAFVDRVMVSS